MFMGPRNWFQGMNSASLCSLAGRYDNPIPPRFLAPIDFLKIPALEKYHKNEEVELDHNKKSEHVHETFLKKTYLLNCVYPSAS